MEPELRLLALPTVILAASEAKAFAAFARGPLPIRSLISIVCADI